MESEIVRELRERLARLEDIEEIRQLRYKYHYFINEGLFDRFSELYTDDGKVQIDYVASAKGMEEIKRFYRELPSTLDFIKQFIHNHMVDVRGDEASGIAYLEARYARAGESIMVAGRFDEQYRRTASGWKITDTFVKLFYSVPLQVGWAGQNLHHIKTHEELIGRKG